MRGSKSLRGLIMTLCRSTEAGNWTAACGARGRILVAEQRRVEARVVGKRADFKCILCAQNTARRDVVTLCWKN